MRENKVFGVQIFSGLVFFLIVLVSDQLSKHLVLDNLKDGESLEITSFFNIILVWNRGISFGFLGGLDYSQVRWIIAFVSILIMLLLLYWLILSNRFLLSIGLGMMLGGAMGNVVDRLVFGAVIDFIHLYWREFNWYIFNIADIGVSCGVGFMILDIFISRNKLEKDKDEEKAREE